MIKLLRVDHRLLHGQVVFKWSNFLDIDCILIANDGAANDKLRMAALRMAKPEHCKLVIKSVEDSIAALNKGVTDKYKLLIITETIEDAYQLATNVSSINYINLGGTRIQDDRKQISKAIFVSEKDVAELHELHDKGIKMEIQMVPDDKAEDVMNLI